MMSKKTRIFFTLGKHLFFRGKGRFLFKEDGWHGMFFRPPAAEGTHWGMGGARTDRRHPVTGPIIKKYDSPRKKRCFLILVLFLITIPLYSQEKEEEKNAKYFSSTSFSTLMTSGNTEDFSLSIDTDQNLHLSDHRFNFKGNIIYSLSNGEKKSEIYASSINYNWQVNSKVYILGLTRFTRNVFSGYNFRFAFSGGAGYSFLDKEKIQFSSDLALGWSTENNAEIINQEIIENGSSFVEKVNVTESFFSTALSTKFIWKLSSTTSLENDGMIFLNLEDLEGYRVTSYSSISVSINQNFALKTSFQINYENKPVPGYKTTDMFILSSIVFKM